MGPPQASQRPEELLKRQEKLPATEAATIVYQALLGLQHLYESGIVHRDLNPANLMVLPAAAPSSPPLVKILDVGLGRALFQEADDEEDVNDEDLTKVGAVLGAPRYMAPEQGVDAHACDTRADIYSLGCVLYHALTGQPPFQDKNVLRLIVMHSKERPRPLRELDANLPDRLQNVVDTMMAKDPAQRFQTPEQAADVLRGYLRSETVSLQVPAAPALLPSYRTWLESTAALEDSTPERETATFQNEAIPQATLVGGVNDGLPVAIPVNTAVVDGKFASGLWAVLRAGLAALQWSVRLAMRLLDHAQNWIAKRGSPPGNDRR